ncbi:hypothetical protein BH09MYX1_BH09MYX1_10020 [soil metagenome]
MRLSQLSLAVAGTLLACSSSTPGPVDASSTDSAAHDGANDAATCLPLTHFSRCAGVNCGPGSYCTDTTKGANQSGLCKFFDPKACSCGSCDCAEVPTDCTCAASEDNGVVVDCRK